LNENFLNYGGSWSESNKLLAPVFVYRMAKLSENASGKHHDGQRRNLHSGLFAKASGIKVWKLKMYLGSRT